MRLTAPTLSRSRWRRWLVPVGQGAAVLGAGIAIFGLVRLAGPLMRKAHPQLNWGMLLLASLVWVGSYAQLVQLWGSSLPWWDEAKHKRHQSLSWFRAMRVFFVANLARYVPGAIWQFAGLAAMAAKEGASPVAASMGVLLQQVVLLATGFALVLSGAPHILGGWTRALDTVSQVVLAIVLVAALTVFLPRALPAIRRWLERVLKRHVPLPVPPPRAFAFYVVRGALAWVAYGVAFWIFGRALFGTEAPGPWLGITSYISSYLAGLLAVIAPGGIVVREGALVLQLGPAIGTERAVLLAVASRVWLMLLEILSALTVVVTEWVMERTRASPSRR